MSDGGGGSNPTIVNLPPPPSSSGNDGRDGSIGGGGGRGRRSNSTNATRSTSSIPRGVGGVGGGGNGSNRRGQRDRQQQNPWEVGGGPPPQPPPIFNLDNSLIIGEDGNITINNNINNNNNGQQRRAMTWREMEQRERQQRSVRTLMMFLLMLLLMDGEEQQNLERRKRKEEIRQKQLRLEELRKAKQKLPFDLWDARQRQDIMVRDRIRFVSIPQQTIFFNHEPSEGRKAYLEKLRDEDDETTTADQLDEHPYEYYHPRYQYLINKNDGIDYEYRFYESALQQLKEHQRHQDLLLLNKNSSLTNATGVTGEFDSEIKISKRRGFVRKAMGAGEPGGSSYKGNSSSTIRGTNSSDDSKDKLVWHFPWNATGFYRGDWSRVDMTTGSTTDGDGVDNQTAVAGSSAKTPTVSGVFSAEEGRKGNESDVSSNEAHKIIQPDVLKNAMTDILSMYGEDPTMGVQLLPKPFELFVPNITTTRKGEDELEDDGNSSLSSLSPTENKKQRRGRESSNSSYDSKHRQHQNTGLLRGTAISNLNSQSSSNGYDDDMHNDASGNKKDSTTTIRLSRTSGRSAFQLYARPVPAMKELSLIDGFIKLYDSSTVGYSTSRDVLLRVRGILIHSIGRMSLVANTGSAGRAAFVFSTGIRKSDDDTDYDEDLNDKLRSWDHRRLKEEVLKTIEESSKLNGDPEGGTRNLDLIRDAAVSLFHAATDAGEDPTPYASVMSTLDREQQRKQKKEQKQQNVAQIGSSHFLQSIIDESRLVSSNASNYSMYVIPYPFVWDDEEQSIRKNRLPRSKRPMPVREQVLEANAGSCEFEINLNIQEEQWPFGQWRDLISKQVLLADRLDPYRPREQNDEDDEEANDAETTSRQKNRRTSSYRTGNTKSAQKRQKAVLEQALAMTINGTIVSRDCGFKANVNATAIRTDWEYTTGKAINYSFFMMLTCLTQIVLLLRQLLHTQAQSAAVRVSLLCVGWQTVVDALLCLVHIYLSLAIQPLFSAFASVAFFKLLIFCVIEMKYMAIIIQARNSQNGGSTIELLRKQIAMLHLRFYVALLACCLGFFYSGEEYRTLYMLGLYSFWVPQIVQNVITETKRPLHPHYVYGMSISRLVAPLYMFGIRSNFLKEVYPESPTNAFMCGLLILWVAVQAGLLEAQGRYGARFMIPARFLPPKYDYHRPLPRSLLNPPGENPSKQLDNERMSPKKEVEVRPVVNKLDASPKARNRIKGSKVYRPEPGMTAETIHAVPKPECSKPDCVICYTEIDPDNPPNYMVAPCDHVFHKDCLIQWMSVKMECPICRKDLPVV